MDHGHSSGLKLGPPLVTEKEPSKEDIERSFRSFESSVEKRPKKLTGKQEKHYIQRSWLGGSYDTITIKQAVRPANAASQTNAWLKRFVDTSVSFVNPNVGSLGHDLPAWYE